MTRPTDAEIARVLRDAATAHSALADFFTGKPHAAPHIALPQLRMGGECRALADALDALPAVTWEERVRKLPSAYEDFTRGDRWPDGDGYDLDIADALLRAAFPEYAPKEPTP